MLFCLNIVNFVKQRDAVADKGLQTGKWCCGHLSGSDARRSNPPFLRDRSVNSGVVEVAVTYDVAINNVNR